MPTPTRSVLLLLGISLGCELCAQADWYATTALPKARALHAAVLDVQRNQVVLFGGNTNAGVQRDTWLWSAATGWQVASPALSPSARREHAMAYDVARGETVLFGGYDGAVVGDTWIWNGTSWRNAAPANSPTARMAEMAYDPTSGKVLLFGGQDATNVRLNDTWWWDGTTWTQLQPAATPPPRVDHDLTTDWTRGGIVMFGGWDAGFRGDTWAWNGSNWLAVATTGPAARSEHKLAFLGSNVFLFSGEAATGRQQDTWRWDGTAWTQLAPTVSPIMREEHVFVGGLTAGVALLFGGWDSSTGHLADFWSFSGTQWTQLTATQPTGTGTGAMDYDPVAKQSVLFGGYQDQQVSNQTWAYGSGTWTRLAPSTSPPARAEPAMAYDRVRGELVLFGGVNGTSYYNDTWVFRGGNWIQRTPSTSPPARWGHAMTFDESRGTVLLFSGRLGGAATNLTDTWEWNGTNWTQLIPATAPRGREDPGLVFDVAHGEPIMFGGWIGGSGFSNETWAFRAGNWVLLTPTTAPSARSEQSMAYDRARACVVMFGGEDVTGRVNDTWEFTTDWVKRSPSHGPERREEAVMVFDENVDEIVLAVGWDIGHFTDTWHFAARPTATASVYGTSCQGSAPALPALASTRPWLGQSVDVRVLGVPSGASAFVLLGAGRTSFLLDSIGMPGCVLLTVPVVTLAMTTSGTGASLALPLPSTPSLAGGVIDLQAAVLAPGANPTGVLATNGVELKAAIR